MKCTVCGQDTLANYGHTKDIICSSCVKLGLTAYTRSTTDYNTAIGVAAFISFLGWLAVVSGISLAVFLLKQGQMAVLYVPVGITISLVGLLLVVCGQIARAIMDNANHSKEIADIMKNTFEIIKSATVLQAYNAGKNLK